MFQEKKRDKHTELIMLALHFYGEIHAVEPASYVPYHQAAYLPIYYPRLGWPSLHLFAWVCVTTRHNFAPASFVLTATHSAFLDIVAWHSLLSTVALRSVGRGREVPALPLWCSGSCSQQHSVVGHCCVLTFGFRLKNVL